MLMTAKLCPFYLLFYSIGFVRLAQIDRIKLGFWNRKSRYLLFIHSLNAPKANDWFGVEEN